MSLTPSNPMEMLPDSDDRIFRRLGDLGWADEVQKTATRRHLDGHELVAKTQPLTDEGSGTILATAVHF